MKYQYLLIESYMGEYNTLFLVHYRQLSFCICQSFLSLTPNCLLHHLRVRIRVRQAAAPA